MKINRKCKTCGNNFIAKKDNNFFCCRKCFKKDFYRRMRSHMQDMEQKSVFPSKQCGFCLKFSNLNFDPTKSPKEYDDWMCPLCGVSNKMVWENQDKNNSYQVISQILISAQFTSNNVVHQNTRAEYKIYQLPVKRLEQADPSVVVMPCERVDFFDLVRKRNGRKILFS